MRKLPARPGVLPALLLAAGSAFAQDAQQPSRKELLERDGIVWGSAAAWGVPFQENLGEDAKIAGLSRLWMEVKINFPHFAEVADLDWDKTYVDFLPKVRATASTYEYYRLLQQFIGPRSLSATDVFAETFQRMQRGKLVGEPTGGSTGDPLAFALPGGGWGRVATSADAGDGLVGRGVQPDILAPRTVRDFLAGHDAALSAAIAALRSPS